MMHLNGGHVLGIPTVSEPSTPEHVSLYIHCTLFGLSKLKQTKGRSFSDWMNKFTSLRDHVKLGPKISETVKGKLSLGTKILQAGGIKRVFRQSFSFGKGEKLLKAFQCYLSTTAGPIAGLLFVSNKKIAFISDRQLTVTSSDGKVVRVPYKVMIPLIKIKSTNQIDHVEKPSKRFMQIVTVDNFEFWFMGFLCYQQCISNLKSAISQYHMSSMGNTLVSNKKCPLNSLVLKQDSCVKG